MEFEETVSLAKRLLRHIDNDTTDYADGVMMVPFSNFTDPGLAAKEVSAARRQPHVVAHVSEVPAAGDFITTELLGAPLLIVRQGDRSIKAFLNTCRHRGARVEFGESGCKRIFTCPYHNWAYGRDGSLRALPHEKDFDGMDKAEFGLLEYPCEVRYGLVWVTPTVGASMDIAGLIGAKHDEELRDTGINEAWQHRKRTFDHDMNWKVVVDGVQDSYHLCELHTTTVCPLLHGNVYALDVEPNARAWRIVVARKTLETIRDKDLSEVDVRDYTLANYTVYPGTMLVTEPAHFEIWSITPHPTDPAKSRTTIRLLSRHKPETDKAVRFYDKNWDLLMQTVVDEDWFTAQTISGNAPAGQGVNLIYGRNDKPCQVFHTTLAADVAALGER